MAINFIYILTGISVIISFIANREKTKKAIIVSIKKLWKITPAFFSILIVVSIVLYLIPDNVIIKYLGSTESYFGIITASIIGSVTVMPGPITYPLCAILVKEGVSYSVIAAFSSSLMLVGVISFPLEKTYFGKKFAILRNVLSLIIALIIALIFSLVEGRLL